MTKWEENWLHAQEKLKEAKVEFAKLKQKQILRGSGWRSDCSVNLWHFIASQASRIEASCKLLLLRRLLLVLGRFRTVFDVEVFSREVVGLMSHLPCSRRWTWQTTKIS